MPRLGFDDEPHNDEGLNDEDMKKEGGEEGTKFKLNIEE